MSQFYTLADMGGLIRDLQQRLSTLERTKVTHGDGAPPTGFTEPYVDDTNSRVYFYVDGVAKYATLT